jgi:hypothetical protein
MTEPAGSLAGVMNEIVKSTSVWPIVVVSRVTVKFVRGIGVKGGRLLSSGKKPWAVK